MNKTKNRDGLKFNIGLFCLVTYIILVVFCFASVIPGQRADGADTLVSDCITQEGSWNGSGTGSTWLGLVFQTSVPGRLTTFTTRIWRTGTVTDFDIYLYSVNATSHLTVGDPLDSIKVNDAVIAGLQVYGEGNPDIETTFDFGGDYSIEAGHHYAIVFEAGTTNNQLTICRKIGLDGHGIEYGSSQPPGNYLDTMTLGHKIYADPVPLPIVQTMNAIVQTNPDRITVGGIVSHMGDNEYIDLHMEWGFTIEYGHNSTVKRALIAGSTSLVQDIIEAPSPGVVYHYRAVGNGDVSGLSYGEDKTISIDDYMIPDVRTKKVEDVTMSECTVGAEVWGLGGEDSLIVSVEICGVATFDETGINIPLSANVTELTIYTKSVTALEPACRYYYRAKAIGAVHTYYGATYNFMTDDPEKMGIINLIQHALDKMGMGGAGFWWLALLVLLVVPWIWCWRKPWLGVVADAVIFGVFLASKVLDLWLVMLLAVIAIAAVLVIFKRAKREE